MAKSKSQKSAPVAPKRVSNTAANKARRVAKYSTVTNGKGKPERVKKPVAVYPTEGIYYVGERKYYTGYTDSKRLANILTGNVRHDPLYRSFEIEKDGQTTYANSVLVEESRTKNPKLVAEELTRRYNYWKTANPNYKSQYAD